MVMVLNGMTTFVWSLSLVIIALGSIANDLSPKQSDCQCGSASNGCKFENGTKICDCQSPFLDNKGYCERCDCGRNNISCHFENDRKICTCKEGYFQYRGTCEKNCREYNLQCQHGSKCEDVCQCLMGTSGDECEVIDDCKDRGDGRRKCGYSPNARCSYNVSSGDSYCDCADKDYKYDKTDKTCKICNCGVDGSCSFVEGLRTCNCKENYALNPYYTNDSKCEFCNCGERSTGCIFTGYNIKKCHCEKGYLQKGSECEACNCGNHGVCSFDGQGRKMCDCEKGYQYENGTCVYCGCGYYARCEWNERGEKSCICIEGAGAKDGKCTLCHCYLDNLTISCTFENGAQKCLCPKGFMENVYICEDIDECKNPSACPAGAKCMNTIGSYTCTCKDGFRPYSEVQDPRDYGCVDIDECLELNACPFHNTSECINTQGGYKCQCKLGYHNKGSNIMIEFEGCEKDQSSWKIGYTFLIVGFSFVIIALLIFFLIKKRHVPCV